MIDGEQDTFVYLIQDATTSLLFAQEMERKGYIVEKLVFSKPKKEITIKIDSTTAFQLEEF